MINKIHDDAVIPHYQTRGSAGLDLHCIRPVTLEPGQRELVETGLSIELPDFYEGQIRPRSGLAYKYGVTVLNSPGTIDSDYRGEIKVLLYNAGDSTVSFEKGERIAQLVLSSYVQITELIHNNERGSGGFGSTGNQ